MEEIEFWIMIVLKCGFEQANPIKARAVVHELGYWGFLCNEALCKVPQKLANKLANIVMAD